MGSKTRLSSYCTKRGNNTVNLVTSRKINARLARPIVFKIHVVNLFKQNYFVYKWKDGGTKMHKPEF